MRFRALGFVAIALLSTGPFSLSLRADVTRFISDMNWTSAANGWGPAERDQSNGEWFAGDGGPLRIGGVTYVKGVGTHAYSDIRVPLGGSCSTFNAVIGVDDEMGNSGSVVFAVYGDGTPLYTSGVLTGAAQGVPISVSVNGFNELALIVTDAGDGLYADHADWANASVTCEGAPASQFAPPVNLPALANPHGLTIIDLNGDGRRDVAAANSNSNVVSVWLGNGDGTFGVRRDFATGPAPKSVTVADFNRDGRLDLATPNQDGPSVSVLLSTSNGGQFDFAAAVNYPACFGTHEIDAGDFTGDGVPDIVAACWGGSGFTFLRGIGNGTFAPQVPMAAGAVPVSVVAGDFNADGKLDAAVAAYQDSAVSVLLGRGDGTFNPYVSYQVGSGPHFVRAGDLNGDGILDLVSANDLSNTISVLYGVGNGTFFGAVHFPTGPGPESVAIGDINGDGLRDLVSANSAGNYPVCCNNPGGDTVSLLLNVGGGSFAAPQTFTVGTTPFAVTTGDIDGDGDLDVATANWHSNDVTLLRNGGGAGATYLSDIPWTFMSNGWGPVERDRSNGEAGAGDGGILTLNGVTFGKGLGVHAFSDVRFSLNGGCSSFDATIGVDDEAGSSGSVTFQVYVDGSLRYDSGIMTGATASKNVSVPLSGANQLQLYVTDGGDGLFYDHADWADARVVCQ
jgi:hypothetical protein